jgi:hypothetical protein
MTLKVKQLIESFLAMSDSDKHEATVEILRRVIGDEIGDMSPGTLVGLAEELFLQFDADETV